MGTLGEDNYGPWMVVNKGRKGGKTKSSGLKIIGRNERSKKFAFLEEMVGKVTDSNNEKDLNVVLRIRTRLGRWKLL